MCRKDCDQQLDSLVAGNEQGCLRVDPGTKLCSISTNRWQDDGAEYTLSNLAGVLIWGGWQSHSVALLYSEGPWETWLLGQWCSAGSGRFFECYKPVSVHAGRPTSHGSIRGSRLWQVFGKFQLDIKISLFRPEKWGSLQPWRLSSLLSKAVITLVQCWQLSSLVQHLSQRPAEVCPNQSDFCCHC